MFPVIYSSSSSFCILVPSYNPLIEQHAREVGAPEKAGSGFRPGRGVPGHCADSRLLWCVLPTNPEVPAGEPDGKESSFEARILSGSHLRR